MRQCVSVHVLFSSLDVFVRQDLTVLRAFCRVWATQLQSAVDSLITGTGTGPGTQNCTTVYPELQASKGLLLSSVQGLNGCHSLCSACWNHGCRGQGQLLV